MNVSQTQPLSQEELARLGKLAQEKAKAVLHKLPLLGPVAWLMMQQGPTRHVLLSDLEWRVMPPLVLDQAKLYMREESPLAFVSWARLSADVAERYRQPPHRLSPGDWKSGDAIWIVDLIAPFGGGQEVIDDLRKNQFAGQPLNQLVAGEEAAKVITWSAVEKPN